MSAGPWKKDICRCGRCRKCRHRELQARRRRLSDPDRTGERMPWPDWYFAPIQPDEIRNATPLYGLETSL